MATAKARECKHFEVCQLPGAVSVDGAVYCHLHNPERRGNAAHKAYEEQLHEYVASGKCDFRYMVFADDHSKRPFVAEHRFLERADFSYVKCRSLSLEQTRFEKGLVVIDADVSGIGLEGARSKGPIELRFKAFAGGMTFSAATLNEPLTIRIAKGHCEISVSNATFHSLTLQCPRVVNFDLSTVRFLSRCVIHGRLEHQYSTEFRFDNAKFEGDVDWSECSWAKRVDLHGARFGKSSSVDLRGCTFGDGLLINELEQPPIAIVVDAAVFNGPVTLSARLGKPALRITARNAPPRFQNGAALANVDLSDCLLVGNDLEKLGLSEVTWATIHGRAALYDETNRKGISVDRLRETVQYLKEHYKTRGNHVVSGDFHYGEMELKRRTSRWWRRFFAWEAFYWAFSGYGTRPLRALIWLVAVTCGSAVAYRTLDSLAFPDLFAALRFSAEVVTLQRPTPAWALSPSADLTRVLEAVLGAVLIALLALALRMKLKR